VTRLLLLTLLTCAVAQAGEAEDLWKSLRPFPDQASDPVPFALDVRSAFDGKVTHWRASYEGPKRHSLIAYAECGVPVFVATEGLLGYVDKDAEPRWTRGHQALLVVQVGEDEFHPDVDHRVVADSDAGALRIDLDLPRLRTLLHNFEVLTLPGKRRRLSGQAEAGGTVSITLLPDGRAERLVFAYGTTMLHFRIRYGRDAAALARPRIDRKDVPDPLPPPAAGHRYLQKTRVVNRGLYLPLRREHLEKELDYRPDWKLVETTLDRNSGRIAGLFGGRLPDARPLKRAFAAARAEQWDKSAKLARALARLGDAWAMEIAGRAAQNSGDTNEALRWLRSAAFAESSNAQLMLARILLGDSELPDVAADPQEALTWLRCSVSHRNGYAEHYLAYLYDYGKHVRQDRKRAYQLYRRAVEHGDNSARKRLRELEPEEEEDANE
jgi:hypothetical protein